MRLYLIQHAQPVDKAIDPERPLSERGLEDAWQLADFLKPLKLTVDAIYHSTKKRTAQTAQALSGAVKSPNPPKARNDLSPNDEVAPLARELTASDARIMIVGHQPFLGKLAALLLTGSEKPPIIAFQQGTLVALTKTEDQQWQLTYMITPTLLSR